MEVVQQILPEEILTPGKVSKLSAQKLTIRTAAKYRRKVRKYLREVWRSSDRS